MVTKRIVLFLVLGCIGLQTFAANYRHGLHLQFPDCTIEIKRSDIEEMLIYQTSPNNASALIKFQTNFANNVYKVTTNEIDQQMVLVLNGRVVGVQKIEKPINGYINVPNLTPFEADDLKRESEGPHPQPLSRAAGEGGT
jgi:hypothetical protein